ncbi:MAG: energy transducer TonB [Betaproteobacteria bacterium]|nr:energy transducer TonB [Betaproteobacteria bacterium]
MKRIALWVALAHGLVIAAALFAIKHETVSPPRPLSIQLQSQSAAAPLGAVKSPAPGKRVADQAPPQQQRDLLVQQPKDIPPSITTLPITSVASPAPNGAPTASSAAASAAEPARSLVAEERQPSVDASFRGNRIPDYPQMSRRLGEQGAVVLRVMISQDGRAGEIQLSKSSGYSRLDRAAIEAVRDWRFVPALKGGRPVAAWYEWRWEFRLEN